MHVHVYTHIHAHSYTPTHNGCIWFQVSQTPNACVRSLFLHQDQERHLVLATVQAHRASLLRFLPSFGLMFCCYSFNGWYIPFGGEKFHLNSDWNTLWRLSLSSPESWERPKHLWMQDPALREPCGCRRKHVSRAGVARQALTQGSHLSFAHEGQSHVRDPSAPSEGGVFVLCWRLEDRWLLAGTSWVVRLQDIMGKIWVLDCSELVNV